jgi:hypothetical protein
MILARRNIQNRMFQVKLLLKTMCRSQFLMTTLLSTSQRFSSEHLFNTSIIFTLLAYSFQNATLTKLAERNLYRGINSRHISQPISSVGRIFVYNLLVTQLWQSNMCNDTPLNTCVFPLLEIVEDIITIAFEFVYLSQMIIIVHLLELTYFEIQIWEI